MPVYRTIENPAVVFAESFLIAIEGEPENAPTLLEPSILADPAVGCASFAAELSTVGVPPASHTQPTKSLLSTLTLSLSPTVNLDYQNLTNN